MKKLIASTAIAVALLGPAQQAQAAITVSLGVMGATIVTSWNTYLVSAWATAALMVAGGTAVATSAAVKATYVTALTSAGMAHNIATGLIEGKVVNLSQEDFTILQRVALETQKENVMKVMKAK